MWKEHLKRAEFVFLLGLTTEVERVCLDGRYNPKIVFKKYLFVYRRVPDEKYTLIKDHLCLLYINKNFATIVDNSFVYVQDKSKTKKPWSYDSGLSLITLHKIKITTGCLLFL